MRATPLVPRWRYGNMAEACKNNMVRQRTSVVDQRPFAASCRGFTHRLDDADGSTDHMDAECKREMAGFA